MQLLQLLLLTFVVAVAAEQAAPDQQQHTHLRGMLDKLVPDSSPPELQVREMLATWEDGDVGKARKLQPLKEKIVGGETIVVFSNRRLSPEAKMESALVSFDVRSSANCVVSVCGELSKWYRLRAKEQCFDLRIAPKSVDELENGLIRGVSAAYSGEKPVAEKLYLKFDKRNFIDDSICEYEIVSGSKTVRPSEQQGSSQATA